VIVRLMPHEVADLEPVLLMLSKQDRNDLQVIQLVCILKDTATNMNALLVCY